MNYQLIYSSPDEIPIERYYKAQEDITWLLIERVEIAEIKKVYLYSILFDLQEHFTKRMNEVSYKNNLQDFMNVVDLERKKVILEAIKKGLKTLREDLLYCEIEAVLPSITEILKTNKVAIRLTVIDQLATIEREVKGINNAMKIIYKKREVVDTKNNWMRLVVTASKMWGTRIDPKVTVLSEWIEILKILEKQK